MQVDAEQVTVIALLFSIGIAGMKRLWVFGWVYADKITENGKLTEDRNFWRDVALKSMGHTDKALEKKDG